MFIPSIYPLESEKTQLIEWWPGRIHSPRRDASRVDAIQRALDWKRIVQIAAYLLQQEISDATDHIRTFFGDIYSSTVSNKRGDWPPKIPKVVGYATSEYPTFSNVLLHVNGATIKKLEDGAAQLQFDEDDPQLIFSVIDGQHRINGAFLAVQILKRTQPQAKWEIPAEIFLDLDARGAPPRRQAQIFIDVNFYQKKVDRSLVADLFPTARGVRGPLNDMERAQDLGRKLMLEIGPLVGMIQIPGIKYGIEDVVTLATLNSAIEDAIPDMARLDISTLEEQAEFLALCLAAWLDATGRMERPDHKRNIDPQNVVYQGRVLVSVLSLVPACAWLLRKRRVPYLSPRAQSVLSKWFAGLVRRAGMMEGSLFMSKDKFRDKGYLGSGGIARFRDALWAAALSSDNVARLSPKSMSKLADDARATIRGKPAVTE